MPILDIVIVNWNSGDQLSACICSIKVAVQKTFSLGCVVIVDNASTDNSLEGIEGIAVPAKVIKNKKNIGFAAACNQGAAEVSGDYILFLNPDTILYDNSLVVPIAFLEQPENSTVGICGIQLFDDSGISSRNCARFPSLFNFVSDAIGLNKFKWLGATGVHMTEWDHASTRDVDHVIGAFFLVRRPVFDVLNGFDELFFVYLEDLDFSLRARRVGWRSVYLANVQAFHACGGTSRQVKAARLFYSLRSRLLYGFKHFSTAKAFSLFFIMLVVEPWSRFIYCLIKCSMLDIINTVRSYGMLIKNLPFILKVMRSSK